MGIANIILISFGYFDQDILEKISGGVRSEFSIPVAIRRGNLDLSEFYDPARRQYNGSLLLNRIETDFADDTSKTVGLFSVDLFIPILTYIFGQAYLNGRSGIVSTCRLVNEHYGLKADEEKQTERLRKEIIHELGHMFGLIHCSDPVCVMRSGTYVEDIDQKSHKLCLHCRLKLRV
jgi:archaemetzincin